MRLAGPPCSFSRSMQNPLSRGRARGTGPVRLEAASVG